MRKVYAVLGIIVTLVIAGVGFSGYVSGDSYMTFIGIELSQGGFTALIIAFLIYDIIAVKNAFGHQKVVEQMNVTAHSRAQDFPALEGGVCRVRLTRLSSMLGCAMGVRVALNGVEQGVIKNGATLDMTTDRAKNELSVYYNADNTARTLEFDATSGGQVEITLKYTGAVLKLRDSTQK